MTNKKFKHIKLDKVINSENQRIFKTKIHDYSDKNLSVDNLLSNLSATTDILKYNELNTILYSTYSFNEYNKNNTFDLINFSDIKFLYNHFQNSDYTSIKKYLGGITDYFSEQFKNNLIPAKNTQNISYINLDNTPIDVINISNMAYFLSPFQTVKNVEIQNQEQLLKNSNYNFNIPYKNNYSESWNYMTNRSVIYPEQNTIPIYDLKYNFLETISFSNLEELTDWLDYYDFLSGQCIINEEAVEISSYISYIKDDYYSVQIAKIFDVIQTPDFIYKFSTENIKSLLIDLLTYINGKTSINNYLDRYGYISKLDPNILNEIIKNSNILSSIFYLPFDEVKNNIENTFIDSFTINEIPQNSIYISNLNKNIELAKTKYTMPSVYMDFFNLKNTQNPNYEYDIELPSVLYNLDTLTKESLGEYIITLYAGKNTEIISGDFNPKANYNIALHIDLPSGVYKFTYDSGYLYSDLKKDTELNAFEYIFSPSSNTTDSVQYPALSREIGVNWNLPPEYLFIRKDYLIDAKNPVYDSLLYNRLYNPGKIIYYKVNPNDEYKNLTYDIISSYALTESIQRSEKNINNNDFKITVGNNGIDLIICLNNNNKIKKSENSQYEWTNLAGSINFKLKNIADEYQLEQAVYNFNTISIFDNDKTKSLEFNKSEKYDTYKIDNYTVNIPTKNIIEQIVNYAASADLLTAENNQNYKLIYNNRMADKKSSYLNPFNERHIENNKIAEIGQANGIRIYEKLGESNNFPWISYKYIASKRNDILNAFNIIKNSIFKEYNIYRLEKHMEYDKLNNVKYYGVENIKEMNTQNDIYKPYVFFINETNYICSSCFHCQLPKGTICNKGYCTLPYNIDRNTINASAVVPNGVFWSLSGYENYKNLSVKTKSMIDNAFIIENNNNYNQQLIAKTPIEINDDLEIFFVSAGIEQEFLNYLDNCTNDDKKYEYLSIFQGFGGTNESINGVSGKILYDNYLFRNNKDIKTEKTYKNFPVSSYCDTIKNYIKNIALNSSTADKPICEFFNIYLANLLNTYTNIDKETEEYINDNTSGLFNTWLYSTNTNILLSASPILSGLYTYYNNLPDNIIDNKISVRSVFNADKLSKLPGTEISYYELANMNLYDIIKDISNTTKDNITLTLSECPDKRILQDTFLIYNGFVINPYTPFNGPHTIKENTVLTGVKVTPKGDNIYQFDPHTSEIPSGYNIVMRVVNWWNNTPKCIGNFLLQPADITGKVLSNEVHYINTALNNYDMLETIDNNFRYNQGEYSKSNIYSIKIRNSGLNPNNKIIPDDLKQNIVLKDYIMLDNKYKILYTHISYNEIESNFDSLCNIGQPLYNIYQTTTVPYLQALDPSKHSELLKKYYEQNNGYYTLDTNKISMIENTKNEIRNILESAIKNSITRYMPIDTKLWKIIYEGK